MKVLRISRTRNKSGFILGDKMKKKLLFVVEAMGGGVFTYVVDLSNKLADDYEVYIAYAVRKQTPKDYIQYFDSRVHLIKLKNLKRSISPYYDFKAFFDLKRLVKKIKPDIIHLHSSKAGVLGRYAFNGHKVPVFYTPHGYSFLMEDCSWVKKTTYWWIEKLAAKRFSTTIACSPGEYRESLKLSSKSCYVNNGINIKKLSHSFENVISEKNESPTVFTLGRISFQKNPKLFNKIATSLPKIKFIWIGDGALSDELKASNIEVKGWMEREEALKVAKESDVFLLTSKWEGLPISLLEAMYMRKPCVVSDVIGNNDVIKNGYNGFTCNKVIEYSDAILQSLANDSHIKNMVDTAYDNVLETYNMDIVAKEYRQIYQKSLTD
jgi:glycosyltransferase involved in cell wall biosynthesis